MSDYQRELETATKIAREAAVVVRGYRGKRLHIESKSGGEPVTEADKAANTLILKRLSAAFPDDTILSEEVPDSGARLGRRRSGWSIQSTAPATSSWATPGSW